MAIDYLNNKVFEANIIRFKQCRQDKLRHEMLLEDVAGAARRRADEASAAHLTNKQKDCWRADAAFSYAQNVLAADFLLLAQNIIKYRKFHFVEAEDAIQEFVIVCFDKIERFDPDKGKAFNFLTTVALNQYRQLYRASKNYNEFKRKLHHVLQDSAEFGDTHRRHRKLKPGEKSL